MYARSYERPFTAEEGNYANFRANRDITYSLRHFSLTYHISLQRGHYLLDIWENYSIFVCSSFPFVPYRKAFTRSHVYNLFSRDISHRIIFGLPTSFYSCLFPSTYLSLSSLCNRVYGCTGEVAYSDTGYSDTVYVEQFGYSDACLISQFPIL